MRSAGWTVSVICPTSEQYSALRETIDDIHIYRHPLPLEAHGKAAFLVEYAAALFQQTRLLFTVHRERGFDVIQGCNPPDLLFIPALPWKLFGKKYVYDHHDSCPELMVAKFGHSRIIDAGLRWLQKVSFRIADLVVTANETFRELAIERGGKKPADVVTVYSIPDSSRFFRTMIKPAEAGRPLRIGYVGVIGEQDGVDNFIRALAHMRQVHQFQDFEVMVVGDGPALAGVKRLAESVGVADKINFTGFLTKEVLANALSNFDIAVIPDTVNVYNNQISMNKVFEYSMMGLPIASYRLKETERLLGNAAIYAEDSSPEALGDAIFKLCAAPELRADAGRKSKAVAEQKFDWAREADAYIAALERIASSVEPSRSLTAVVGTDQ